MCDSWAICCSSNGGPCGGLKILLSRFDPEGQHMCKSNCLHSEECDLNNIGLNCDLNNDSDESLCDTCRELRRASEKKKRDQGAAVEHQHITKESNVR